MMTNWKTLLAVGMKDRGETLDDLVFTTLTPEQMTERFNDGYGCSEGGPFTAWSEKYVYFPVVYDGAEWVASVPRNPCDEATSHVGGE